MLSGAGRWIANRRLPEPAKKALAEEWKYIMTGEKPKSMKKKKKKWTQGSIHIFRQAKGKLK